MGHPLVTFVIAAYNAEEYIDLCLSRIRCQTYPQDSIEILVCDGGSSDRTKEIAENYQATVLPNPDKIAEFAKAVGIKNAKGKYVVILDTDNEISHDDWLEKNVIALEADESIIGIDPVYQVRKGDHLINRYCAHLIIEDPIVRYMAVLKFNSNRTDLPTHSVYTIKPGRFPIFGSNGFIWRKSILDKLGGINHRYDEADFCVHAIERGYNKIGFIEDYGVLHHHLKTVSEFIGKRFRRGREFMTRTLMPEQEKIERRTTWLDKYSKAELFGSIFLCSTILHPAYEAIKGFFKTKDKAWLLHPFLSAVTIVAYGGMFVKYRLIKIFAK